MTEKKAVYRIKENGIEWENTPVREQRMVGESVKWANKHAKSLANTFDAEVRWNWQGSSQGHYVTPES